MFLIKFQIVIYFAISTFFTFRLPSLPNSFLKKIHTVSRNNIENRREMQPFVILATTKLHKKKLFDYNCKTDH